MLFVNALERFNDLKGKQDIIEYINIDVKSYQNYVNKARIFDLLDKNKVVLEFNNFETLINSKIKELSAEILKRKGNVAIDNFESSGKVLKDLEQIEPKYIKYKLENIEEKLQVDGVTLIQNNGAVQEVKHYHLHLKPYYKVSQTIKPVEEIYEILTK